jgi:hypothetical protein
MMGVGRMENEYELIAAFLGMLDKIQKAESAVLVVNGWPLAELIMSSGERPFAFERVGERAGGYGWRRGSSLLFT